MKIRLADQSIRFRLSPEDIEALKRRESLRQILRVLPAVEWSFELKSDSALKSGRVQASGSQLSMQLPEIEIFEWLESKSLSWEYKQTDTNLEVFVEKDVKPDRDEKMKSRMK